jgi:hypothetical protein
MTGTRLTETERTQAFARYARTSGWHADVVRAMPVLREAALREWCEFHGWEAARASTPDAGAR